MLRRVLALLTVAVPASLAAPPSPPAPDAYAAHLRYQINAYRSERVKRYHEMLEALKKAGFERSPADVAADDEPDNPKATRMHGSIAAKDMPKLLEEPHFRSVLLYPKGTKLPEKRQRVRVEVRLARGFAPAIQRQLARQTARVLTKDAGFVEAVGYDSPTNSRLVGSVPAEDLDKLVEDVRGLPSAKDEAGPLSRVSPIRITVARPDWPVPSGRPSEPSVPEKEIKFTPALRELLKGPDAGKANRLQAVLGHTPEDRDRSWAEPFDDAGAVVEGRLGPVVTFVGVPKDVAPKLAEKSEIAHVRLPRAGRPVAAADDAAKGWEPARPGVAADIHAVGRRGKGTRLAVIGDNFRGWQKLPNRPTLVDLTAERTRDLLPDPTPGKAADEGHGARRARSLLAAAPEAELTLVRIDPHAPYMLHDVAKAINGEGVQTISLDARNAEIRRDRAALDRRKVLLDAERRKVLDNPHDEDGEKRLEAYRADQAAYDRDNKAQLARRDRYFALLDNLRKLKGVHLVASTLGWPDGYALDETNGLPRWYADRSFGSALWFQAAADASGQAWTGAFKDHDANGFLEFVPAGHPLPDGSWSNELNFLSWQAAGKPQPALPGGAKLRVTLQWREAHDPLPLQLGEDVYRDPLTKLKLLVVRQPDPDGKARPADDLDVVAQSVGRPTRLEQSANAATYEVVVEVTVKQPGRYAVMVEGKLPESIQAPGENFIPASRRTGEVRPRLFVQTLAGAGRAVWADFPARTIKK